MVEIWRTATKITLSARVSRRLRRLELLKGARFSIGEIADGPNDLAPSWNWIMSIMK